VDTPNVPGVVDCPKSEVVPGVVDCPKSEVVAGVVDCPKSVGFCGVEKAVDEPNMLLLKAGQGARAEMFQATRILKDFLLSKLNI
jgi:hypothetical protein